MKITNKYNLPIEFVMFAEKNLRVPERLVTSATRLIKPPCMNHLELVNYDVISVDVSELVYSLSGTAVHEVIGRQERKNVLVEEKLSTTIPVNVNGERVEMSLSGTLDNYDADLKMVTDWKNFSWWTVVFGGKEEWEKQLNIYAWLLRLTGFEVERLRIVGLLRDWMSSKSLNDSEYPPCPVVGYEIPIWPEEQQAEYVGERAYKQIVDIGVPCTPEERWHKPDKYAVMKDGRKSAVRLLDSMEDAEQYLKDNPQKGGYIHHRIGEDTRCERFCIVREVCPHRNRA